MGLQPPIEPVEARHGKACRIEHICGDYSANAVCQLSRSALVKARGT